MPLKIDDHVDLWLSGYVQLVNPSLARYTVPVIHDGLACQTRSTPMSKYMQIYIHISVFNFELQNQTE